MGKIQSKTLKREASDISLEPSSCDPFFKGFLKGELKSYPKKLREACGDAFFRVDGLRDFELRVGYRAGSYKVRRGGQLMRHQATYQLASLFLPYLRNPPPGLTFLLDTLRELRGKDKIPVIFEKRIGSHLAGWFRGTKRHDEIHIVDTLSPLDDRSSGIRGMDVSTLYHELGHSLMHHLYGRKIPSYLGSSGHDKRAQRDWESETNPSAAWSEGFARAIGNLDTHSSVGIKDPGQLFPQWFEKSLKSRLSNEYVISAILTDYVKSEVPYKDTKMTKIVLNEASYCRLKKIFSTMRASGLQKDFGIFVRDFLRRHPEEGERLKPLLRDYGLGELAGDRN